MFCNGLAAMFAVMLAGLALAVGPAGVCAGESKAYVVEPPDCLRIEVSGLTKKAPRVTGEYIVWPDGTVSLGTYGSVAVSGLTLDQIDSAIAKHLSGHAKKPDKLKVRAEVIGYNSKVYYVVASGKDGDQVYRFPAQASETVVDAVLQVEGLAADTARTGVWVASPSGKVREVNWRAITQEGRTASNYKLEAGDRVYVGGSPPSSR